MLVEGGTIMIPRIQNGIINWAKLCDRRARRAFACDDLLACLDKLKAKGMKFMTPPPNTYYEMLEDRLPGHGENVDELQKRGILLDGTTENGEPRLLLQIFSETVFGPVFFEFIQRKQDDGFGEGNFKALFESIERDQVNRGVLNK